MARFVKMTKDGETIEVNPLVVDDHKRLGWKEVSTPSEEPAEAKPADKKAAAEAKAAEKKAAAEAKAAEKKAAAEAKAAEKKAVAETKAAENK